MNTGTTASGLGFPLLASRWLPARAWRRAPWSEHAGFKRNRKVTTHLFNEDDYFVAYICRNSCEGFWRGLRFFYQMETVVFIFFLVAIIAHRGTVHTASLLTEESTSILRFGSFLFRRHFLMCGTERQLLFIRHQSRKNKILFIVIIKLNVAITYNPKDKKKLEGNESTCRVHPQEIIYR
jgi:hypothetical protein